MADRNTNFNADLQAGQAGERIVADYFRSLNSVASVTDVSREREWQKKGVDLLVELWDRTSPVKVDVKSDNYPWRNQTLTWEVVSSVERGTPGWGLTSEADRMAFYSPQGGLLYLFSTQKMREFIARNVERSWGLAPTRNIMRGMVAGDRHTSLSLRVPVASVKAIGGSVIQLASAEAFGADSSRRKEMVTV